MIAINFVSYLETDEECVIYSKSDSIKILNNDKTDEDMD